MPYYESVFIARPDISAAQVESLTESLSGIISEGGGSVTKNEYWGLKNLSYRIKKNRKGHYTLLNIDAPPAAIKEMERNMRINEDVLRYLTVKVDVLQEEPSAMMRTRSRDDRGRHDRDSRPDRGGPRRGAGSNDRPRESSGGKDSPPAEANAPAPAVQGDDGKASAADKGDDA